ncbi:MAG: zinc-binding dehydrogenase [Actinomycetota bacterium]|nr:zinc-binding dehydrogenase [Actinomycetota bacterium]
MKASEGLVGMRAVVLRNGELTVRETADPAPGHGELVLKTLSTAICASDVHFMDHPELAIDDPTGRSLYDADRDIVLGHEFVGEVIGYGPGCTEAIPVGSRVTSIPIRLVNGGADGSRIIGQHPESQGSFAEFVVVAEALARAVEGDVASDAVALVDAFAVGEFYVRSAALAPGEIPIVVGAGAIGLSAVAALASRGVEPIIVSDFKAERRQLAVDFGAHIVVDPDVRSPIDVWRETRIERDLWGPCVIFECVGAAGLIQKIVESADMATRIYCAGGWYTGDTLDITTATRQGVSIQFGGGPMPQDWYGTLDAIAAGRLDPLPSVGRVIGLDGVPEALDQARRSDGPPRIVVHPNDGASEATGNDDGASEATGNEGDMS